MLSMNPVSFGTLSKLFCFLTHIARATINYPLQCGLRGRCHVTSPPRGFSHKFVRAFLFSVVKPKSTLALVFNPLVRGTGTKIMQDGESCKFFPLPAPFYNFPYHLPVENALINEKCTSFGRKETVFHKRCQMRNLLQNMG